MMDLELVKLLPLMAPAAGRPEVAIGLVDGPVAIGHPDLESESIRELPAVDGRSCALSTSAACKHGTFVAGILVARRGLAVPTIPPGAVFIIPRLRASLRQLKATVEYSQVMPNMPQMWRFFSSMSGALQIATEGRAYHRRLLYA